MPMYEKPRKYTKMIAKTIVGGSTYYVIRTVLVNNLPQDEEESKYRKVQASVGSGVVAIIVSEKASQWSDDFIDTIFDAFDWSIKPIELENFEEVPE
jgi:hypothetical protein